MANTSGKRLPEEKVLKREAGVNLAQLDMARHSRELC
jgi:hypothetical protein